MEGRVRDRLKCSKERLMDTDRDIKRWTDREKRETYRGRECVIYV
jgi:hypothetical protein